MHTEHKIELTDVPYRDRRANGEGYLNTEIVKAQANLRIAQSKLDTAMNQLESLTKEVRAIPYELITIPAGCFLYGEHKQHIYLSQFEIEKFPVTVAQYAEFCKAVGQTMPSPPSWGWLDNHPIVNVSWNDAAAYAKWAGGRLPTETEWEKAARSTDGRIYPWGNKWDASKCANSMKEKLESTEPVGGYPSGASPYGCHDMAGNVWEWCKDWYLSNYYSQSPASDPQGPESGIYRVLRGGGWYNNAYFNRCAYRNYYLPGYSYNLYGFRLAR